MSEPFIGEIRMFAGNFAPRNWAFCDGQLLAVSQNDALFSLLGTQYGAGVRVVNRHGLGPSDPAGRAVIGAQGAADRIKHPPLDFVNRLRRQLLVALHQCPIRKFRC